MSRPQLFSSVHAGCTVKLKFIPPMLRTLCRRGVRPRPSESVTAFSSMPPPPTSKESTTHFGNATVETGEKKRLVGEVFHRVADKYDLMNDVMSGGVHRLWKDTFVGDRGTVVLDVAGGTGDIAFRISDSMARSFIRPSVPPKIIVTDINPSMLQVGQDRAAARAAASPSGASWRPHMEWRVGDAESLDWVPSNSVDLYTIAFGIRNVTHVEAVLREAFRVLRPGGRFMCLEFSRVHAPVVSQLYEAYSAHVIPAMGAAVSGDRDSYQYLVESIRKFPDQEGFADMIADAGFSGVDYTNFTFGVCAVHTGHKLT